MPVRNEALDASPSAPIQVLVANLPQLTSQAISQLIEEEPDMVSRYLPLRTAPMGVQFVQDLLLSVDDATDVLILGVPRVAPLPGICSNLLNAFPYLKIVAVTPTVDECIMYWLGLNKRRLHAVSGESLVQAIRQAYNLDPTADTESEPGTTE